MTRIFILMLSLLLPSFAAAGQEEFTIERLVIHGNYSITDGEILEMIPFKEGEVITREQAKELEQKLLASGRFEAVEVNIRFTTLDMNGPAALIVRVTEKTSLANSIMYLPLFGSFEGYGFSYGVQTTLVDYFNQGERIGVPFTWGGTKQIGLELYLDENLPFADRMMIGGRYLVRDEHQVFDEKDERLRLMGELGWSMGNSFFLTTGIMYEDITFAETLETSATTATAGIAFDTRTSTDFPYDALYAAYTLHYVIYDEPYENALVNDFDLRLYKRLFGQSVIAAQFKYQQTDTTRPIFNKNFLGGAFWVRGYDEPEVAGDNFYLGTIELRVPLSAVTDSVQWGVTAFYDYAGLWNEGQDVDDALIFEGVGLGGFVRLGFVNIVLEVATPTGDNDGDVQFHGGASFKF